MSGATTTGPVRSDRNVLLDFYRVAGGNLWDHQEGWEDNENDLSTWYGVTLNGQRRVVTLDMQGDYIQSWGRFEGNNILGVIPSDIGQLDALTTLCLGGNKLTGNIPPEVGQLASLTALNLSYNRLCGPIPAALSKLVALTSLELAYNQLTGPIPSELSNVVSLTRLDLTSNILGTIPSWLGKLVALKWLSFSCNQLSGSIPSGLSKLVALETIDLSGNRLTGSIPSGLSKLVALETIDLSTNRLTGSIPSGLSKLVALETIDLSDNSLTGAIPTGLRQLVALKVLILGNNNLTGRNPCGLVALETLEIDGIFLVRELGYNISELSKLPSLNHLRVRGLQEAGFLVSELSKLGLLTNLYLSRHQLDGSTSIPSDIGKLVGLRKLGLDGDGWTGSLPPELFQLAALSELSIRFTALTGSIPSEMSQMASLTIVSLFTNKFSGSIPAELSNLPALETLNLGGNQLTGSIPAELSNLPALETLDLGHNQLTGLIPVEFGKCSALKFLTLEDNLLTGSIPSELGEVSSLVSVNLANNRLTGSIPSELGKMSSLTQLCLYNNRLTGLVPAELGNLTDLRKLHLSFNQLTSLGGVDDSLKLVQRLKGGQRHMHEAGLLLGGNPWITPPEAVVDKGLLAVEAYLTDVRTATDAGAAVSRLKLLKVVLVGSSQAGKTSLMNSIDGGRASATEGPADEVSTVGVNLLRHQMGDAEIEFYDCAGQLDYAGMHQVFLSRRALYLLVWDVTNCHGKQGDNLDEVIRRGVMLWLYALHLRAPDSTVMLVANKCDVAIGDFSSTERTVGKRVTDLLAEWQDSRGIPGQGTGRLPSLNLLPEISCVSCQDGFGLEQVIDRIRGQAKLSFSVPPSWNLALAFVNALRDNVDPFSVVQRHLHLPPTCQDGGDRGPHLVIRKEDIFQRWNRVLDNVCNGSVGQLTAEASASMLNRDSALEGALSISEFAGQILFVDDGQGLFLDVELLSKVLNPILDHKLRSRRFPDNDLISWQADLLDTGVLCSRFARHLWGDVFNSAVSQPPAALDSEMERSLSDVLVKLGVAIPLRRVDGPGGSQPDMLVSRWLRSNLGQPEKETRENLVKKHLEGDADELTLTWQFDKAGSPQGLVGRVIASCHLIGEAERRLCWKTGAVFSSPPVAVGMKRLYVVVIEYTDQVLSVKIVGPLKNDRVWAALRFVASLMVDVSKEWPGVLWQGSIECAEHVGNMVHLSTPSQARMGGPLIAEASRGCDCRQDRRTVVGKAVARLGRVMDTTTGDPFRDCRDSEGRAGNPWYAGGNYLDGRPNDARNVAVSLVGSSFVLFVAAIALEDAPDVMWEICLGLFVVMLIAAGVAGYFSCAQRRQPRQNSNHRQPEPPLGGTASV